MLLREPLRKRRDDAGVALITVVAFVMVAAGLGALVASVSVRALGSSTQDGAAAAAQGVTDAGVAEAINYIRQNGIQDLLCAEGTAASDPTCSGTRWSNPTTPVLVAGGSVVTGTTCPASVDCHAVWISKVRGYQPAAGTPGGAATPVVPGIYRIHSTGISGVGPGGRSQVVDVQVNPARFPFGVFAATFGMPSAGSPGDHIGFFTTGDVTLKCKPTGVDYANNIPAAVHAAGRVSYGGGPCPATPPNPTTSCQLDNPYDQDSAGVSFASTSCFERDRTDPAFSGMNLAPYPASSLFTAQDLARYGYRPGGLSPSEYEQLKAQAVSQGTYNPANLNTALNTLIAQGVKHPVVWYDNGTEPNSDTLPTQFYRAPTSTNCPKYALTIVVKGTDVLWTQTRASNLVASIFLPDSGATFKLAGNASLIGTLFADNIQFNGNGTIALDPCFVANPPGGVLDLTVLNTRNVDTTNIQ